MYTQEECESEATAMAAYYKIEPKQEGETSRAFVARVAGEMRRKGHVIEAHELASGGRYDDPQNNNTMLGILGAVALAQQPHAAQPQRSGCTLVGDERAAGAIVRFGQEPILNEMHAEMVLMLAEAMRR